MDLFTRLLALLKLPLTALAILRSLYADYTDLLARAHAPPGIPVPNPTRAFWQDDPPYPELVDIGSQDGAPPRTADVVIIGSGITAAAVARTLLLELERKGELAQDKDGPVRVLVLEARQLCSGATGRNGGHIKASPHETFHRLATKLGPARAAALCAFQLAHVRAIGDVIAADDDVAAVAEFREVRTVDFAVDAATDAAIKAQVEAFAPWQPPGYGPVASYAGDEARRRFGASAHVVGAVEYPAGALWPYRFVTAVWKRLLGRFAGALAIETGTAVQAVEVRGGAAAEGKRGFPYVLATSRGEVRARHVVHATNAFAAQLVPGLRGKAAGALCHMTAQRAGTAVPRCDGRRSYSVMYRRGFDYVTQRGGEHGELLVGGGLFQSARQGMDMIGDYDDSKTDAMTLMHLEGVMPTVLDWGAEDPRRRLISAWSGLVGMSADMLPLVGRLDPRITGRRPPGGQQADAHAGGVPPGEWIAAYFCGDGMVWAWLCGTAVGVMLAGSERDEGVARAAGIPGGRLDAWFPPELEASWARVSRMDIADLADEL